MPIDLSSCPGRAARGVPCHCKQVRGSGWRAHVSLRTAPKVSGQLSCHVSCSQALLTCGTFTAWVRGQHSTQSNAVSL